MVRNTKKDVILRYHKKQIVQRLWIQFLIVLAILLPLLGAGVIYLGNKRNEEKDLREKTSSSSPGKQKDTTLSGKEPAKTGSKISANGPLELTTETSPKITLAEASGIQELVRKRPRIEDSIRSFFNATSIELRLAYVRRPEKVLPLMKDFYSRQKNTPAGLKSIGEIHPLPDEKRHLAIVSVDLNDDSHRKLIVEEEPGGFSIDWESFVNYSTMSWKEFQEKRPFSPVSFQITATLGDFYFGPFADSNKWECAELVNPNETGILYGYFLKDDSDTTRIHDLLAKTSSGGTPLILDLAFVENARLNQVVIRGVRGHGWLRDDD